MTLTGCKVNASTNLPGKPSALGETIKWKKRVDGPLQSHLLSYKIDMPYHWPPPLTSLFHVSRSTVCLLTLQQSVSKNISCFHCQIHQIVSNFGNVWANEYNVYSWIEFKCYKLLKVWTQLSTLKFCNSLAFFIFVLICKLGTLINSHFYVIFFYHSYFQELEIHSNLPR